MQSLFPDICTNDIAAARDFYVALFDFQPVYDADWYVQLQAPDNPAVQLAFVLRGHETVPAPQADARAAGVLITLEVPDVDAVHARAQALGLPIAQPLRSEIFGQRHFMTVDPDGLLVDVVSLIAPAAEFLATPPVEAPSSPLGRYRRYFADFDRCLGDDDWSRLAAHFSADAVYEVIGLPYACVVRGRDAIVAALRRSVHGFDRRLDGRHLAIAGTPQPDGDRLVVGLRGRYEKAGAPPLEFGLREEVCVADDGRIARLADIYEDAAAAGALTWLAAHGAGLDPRYA